MEVVSPHINAPKDDHRVFWMVVALINLVVIIILISAAFGYYGAFKWLMYLMCGLW
jgi:uncharacterized membrane protein